MAPLDRMGATDAEIARFLSGASPAADIRFAPDRLADGEAWRRIAIAADATIEGTAARIAGAMAGLAPDGHLLIDRCAVAEVAWAIVAAAGRGELTPVVLPDLGQTPRFQIVRHPQGEAPPGERRIILVAVYGERSRLEWLVSRPTTQAYAERIGAELIVIEGELEPIERPLAKMHALEAIGDDVRVMLVDTDIVIRPDAPDLFAIVPPEAIGLFIEGLSADRAQPLAESLERFEVRSAGPYYANTGVFVIPAGQVARFRLSAIDRTMYIDDMYEQNYLNARLHEDGFQVFNISALFNCMPAVTLGVVAQSHFIHFAGGSIVAQNGIAWEEGIGSSGTTLRVRRHLSGKDLRLFDMRNERFAGAKAADTLLPVTRLTIVGGRLMIAAGLPYAELAPWPRRRVARCPLGAVEAGAWRLDLLLDDASLGDAVGLGTAYRIDGFAASDGVEIDLVSPATGDLVVERTRLVADGGVATLDFVVAAETDIVCRIYGQARPFALFGVRLHAPD